MAAVTTLCIVGFPDDVHERELHNLCRWTAGFQEANVVKRTTLFVKFYSKKDAVNALESLNGAPFDAREPGSIMKVEFARREMDVTTPGGNGTEPRRERGRKRGPELQKKYTSTGEELKTITVQKLQKKRFTENQLEEWFGQLEGYISLQYSRHADAVFVKFDCSEHAEIAMIEANGPNDMGAEWARRNLEDDIDDKQPPSGRPHPSAHEQRGWHDDSDDRPPIVRAPRDDEDARRKRPRVSSGDIDTICVLGISGKGQSPVELERWFKGRRGFVALNFSERADGLFVKFASPAQAEQALESANAPPRHFGAEWARRSLDVVGDADTGSKRKEERQPPWHASAGAGGRGGGEVDTITVQGLQGKGLKQQKLQQWFQRCSGYLTMHYNERLDAVFVKFDTPEKAGRALEKANWESFGAEWAR
eukprot:CAMPEP_0115415516 /NCGR_PEP_ID=MMETSP0271-20121206/23138_1 /TAXON_ID=71861 /ORGANISM="Scrippsiella trochoidea, Strain CCMP3099" /LENGTH=420 /DNA_ID=CAMNT_0002839853 /DNA_START=61 /DNA_END=1320 /DNA_ORIENTATION=-